MKSLKIISICLSCLVVQCFGSVNINWQTTGFAVNDNGDGQGVGTTASAIALPTGSLWQLIYSADGRANFNPSDPDVPGGDDLLLAEYHSIGTGISETTIISGDGIAGTSAPITDVYGEDGEYLGGNVYTRIFNSSDPGSNPDTDRYRDTGLVSTPGSDPSAGQAPVNMDVMDDSFSSTQGIEGFQGVAAIEVNIPIPEPSTIAMFGLGILMLVGFRRRD